MIIHSESNKTNNADSGACKIQSCPGNKIHLFCSHVIHMVQRVTKTNGDSYISEARHLA